MLRVGRFRHRLLEDEFLKNTSPLAHKCLQVFMRLWQSKSLSDAEIAAIYILVFSFLRRPKDFLGGPHNKPLAHLPAHSRMSCQSFYELLQKDLPEDLRQAKSLLRFQRPDDLLTYFCSHSWRSIPLSVAQSLMAWESGLYPLRLLSYVPTPKEVLSMQTEGQRCVSMLQDLTEMQEFVEEGRDVLGFIVHDLIHADHFFADPAKARAQIEFSRHLLVVFGFREIQTMLQTDPVFKKEFEYLMSDMNSFPLHLLKTFKAVLLGYFKRREGLAMTAALPEASEAEFQRLFESSLKTWKLPDEAHHAALRLNTPLFQGLDDSLLLHSALLQYQ
ncbi:hypothetical protein [Bdellovibrio bacteriovorus]|uniref:Uncharacterized protein n=1 Tax=Bdellovibrio bacteriovorus TaxID=959 RepID=A0A1Z3N6X2_BDEBC|nr:hypothetical protein [Bdellovibrio bacteriovorus]ASD63214.1 hypothetical protein B9G79_06350 [Bdellovibrio bacteriovorus]